MFTRASAFPAVSGSLGGGCEPRPQVSHALDGVSPYPPGLGPHLSGPDAAASSQVALRWDAYGCSFGLQALALDNPYTRNVLSQTSLRVPIHVLSLLTPSKC